MSCRLIVSTFTSTPPTKSLFLCLFKDDCPSNIYPCCYFRVLQVAQYRLGLIIILPLSIACLNKLNTTMTTMMMMIVLLSLLDLSSSTDLILNANVGQDVTFPCVFNDQSEISQVSFMRQMTGDILSLGDELLISDATLAHQQVEMIRFAPNRLDLKLFSVNENDSGLYTCMLNDEQLSSFLLEIFVPPRFVSYSPLDASVFYPEGTSLNLSCRVYAVPSANITWIYRSKSKQAKTILYGENLYISSLQSLDSGSYECIASNMFHASISRAFYVTVQYPPRVFINKVNDSHVRRVKFNCRTCAFPLAHIEWHRNGTIIVQNHHIHIKSYYTSEHDDECFETSLIIHDFTQREYGRYECRAENILGHNSAHVDLVMKMMPQVKVRHHSGERTALLILLNATHTNIISGSDGTHLSVNMILLLFINQFVKPV